MAVKQKHSLTLTHRPPPHVHRWLPTCSCGWKGIPLRDQDSAATEYRAHVQSETRRSRTVSSRGGARVRRSRQKPGPKPLTKPEDLPPELR